MRVDKANRSERRRIAIEILARAEGLIADIGEHGKWPRDIQEEGEPDDADREYSAG
jgi:hypothetical protein